MEKNFNTNVNTNLETNHIIDLSDRLYKIMVAIIAVAAVFLIGQVAYQFNSLPQNTPREISVNGEGKAFAKPDIALISLGVTSQASKSQDAVNENNQKMNEIINAIKSLDVEDKDIQTTLYNLYPVYGSDSKPVSILQERSVIYPYPVPNNKIVGYSLEQQLQVKIRDFDKINNILDTAADKGANMVGNLQFTVDDMEKFRAEAREKAIAKAKEKAKSLFNQSGLKIEKLVNISEGYWPGPVPIYSQEYGITATKESTAPQIQTGQMEINMTVTLTYRVR